VGDLSGTDQRSRVLKRPGDDYRIWMMVHEFHDDAHRGLHDAETGLP
jgi:hypothetical protein